MTNRQSAGNRRSVQDLQLKIVAVSAKVDKWGGLAIEAAKIANDSQS